MTSAAPKKYSFHKDDLWEEEPYPWVCARPLVQDNTIRVPVTCNLYVEKLYLDDREVTNYEGPLHGMNFLFEGVRAATFKYRLCLDFRRHWRHKEVILSDFPEVAGDWQTFRFDSFRLPGYWDSFAFRIEAQSVWLEAPKGSASDHAGEELPAALVSVIPTRWDRIKALFREPPLPWDDIPFDGTTRTVSKITKP